MSTHNSIDTFEARKHVLRAIETSLLSALLRQHAAPNTSVAALASHLESELTLLGFRVTPRPADLDATQPMPLLSLRWERGL